MDALYNIQALLSKVQDVDVNSHVLDTYKTALNSLKTTFKETGLSEDKVINTMLELEEVNKYNYLFTSDIFCLF